jgi:DNA-binding transcriptional regulator YhcF (GntR family)
MKRIQDLRSEQIENGELWDELKVENLWIHIVRGLIKDKVIAKIGAPAFCVYIAIKAHTDLNTGSAWPSVALLGEQVGISKDTVLRSLKTLVSAGLLTIEKQGRKNKYEVIEKINIVAQSGELWGDGQKTYVATGFGSFVDDLKKLAKTGNLPGDKGITINLVVNVQQNAAGATGNMNIQNNLKAEIDEAIDILTHKKTD